MRKKGSSFCSAVCVCVCVCVCVSVCVSVWGGCVFFLSEQMTAAHLATGSAWDWFIVKELFFFFFTHDSIWYGAGYMLPNMPVQMFSQLGVLSPVSALASDEACWQRNGRENLGRLHQMAALLRHLSQDLVDGKLAQHFLFFFLSFFLSSPSFLFLPPKEEHSLLLLSCPPLCGWALRNTAALCFISKKLLDLRRARTVCCFQRLRRPLAELPSLVFPASR